MKKFCILALTFVLTAAMMTACRNGNGNMTTTISPTTRETAVPTATHSTTVPSSTATQPHTSESGDTWATGHETTGSTNGSTNDSTNGGANSSTDGTSGARSAKRSGIHPFREY